MIGGCMVEWWLAQSPYSKSVPSSSAGWEFSRWSFPQFPPDMHGFFWGLMASSHSPLTCMWDWLVILNWTMERLTKHGSFFSVWPCEGLATCPGFTPPLTQWHLGHPPASSNLLKLFNLLTCSLIYSLLLVSVLVFFFPPVGKRGTFCDQALA